MKTKHLTWSVVALVTLVASLLMLGIRTEAAETARQAETGLMAAWQLALERGSYRYQTSIVQTTWPLPVVENVGLTAKQDYLYLEGQTDLPGRSMALRLWSEGGSAVTGEQSIELRVVDDEAMGRVGGGEWKPVDDFTSFFAPGRDLLGYLAGAKNIVNAGTEVRAGLTLTRYTFDVDGRAFAEAMRDQMEDELSRGGKLPAGLELDLVQTHVKMTGQGEVWLDGEGLPVRQSIELRFPPDRYRQVDATIETIFSDWGETPEPGGLLGWLGGLDWSTAGWQGAQLVLLSSLLALIWVERRAKVVYAGLVALMMVTMLVTPLLEAEQVHAFMVEQSALSAAVEKEQAQAEATAAYQQATIESAFDPHADPLSTVQAAAPAWLAAGLQVPLSRAALPSSDTYDPDLDDGTDSDLDGLTDYEEGFLLTNSAAFDTDGDGLSDGSEVRKLGTNPLRLDTDGDRISDRTEVAGFYLYGIAWYLNPLQPDSNRDGQPDPIECPWLMDVEPDASGQDSLVTPAGVTCQDTDSDGTPDVFDRDDDGDGVPDTIDLAPDTVVGGGPDATHAITGLKDDKLSFRLDNLTADAPTLVDLQIRPVNPDHLWYSLNVLDWPSGDTEGQIQRVHDTSFQDYYDAVGAQSTPKDANGDLKLIPMLEIEIPFQDGHAGNLPLLPGAPPIAATTPLTAWLDIEMLADYGISVQRKDNAGNLLAYVPVTLVQDPTGQGPVAFGARMIYQPDGSGFGLAHTARLVWLLQGITDYCTEVPAEYQGVSGAFISRDAWCADKSHWATNPPRVLHTYYDDWYLAGLAVREDHGAEAAVVLENADHPNRNPDYEQYLWQLALNLDQTFLAGRATVDGQGRSVRDLTLDLIQQRFDITSTATITERWGIPNGALIVDRFSYADQTHLAELPLTTTQQILNQYLPGGMNGSGETISPTLLFLREEQYRSAGLTTGEVTDGGAVVTKDGGLLDGNALSLDLDPSQSENQVRVLASMNWAPFRYLGADLWEGYPIAEYWEAIKGSYPDLLADACAALPQASICSYEDPEGYVNAGGSAVLQGFYLSLFAGSSALVQLGDQALTTPAAQSDLQLMESRWIEFGSKWGVTVSFIETFVEGAVEDFRSFAVILQQTGNAYSLGHKIISAIGAGLSNIKSTWAKAFNVRPNWDWGRGAVSGAAIAMVTAAVVGVLAYTAIGLVLGLEGEEILFHVLDGVSFILQMKSLISAISEVQTAVKSAKGLLATMKSTKVDIGSAANVAAIVGLIISAGVSIGFFVAQMVQAGIRFASLDFNLALAGVIAGIIVGVIMFAISLIPVVGPLITAIIGLIDTIIGLVCKLTGLDEYKLDEDPADVRGRVVREYVCGGISGALAKLVQFFIYDQTPIVNLEAEDRLGVGSFRPQLESLTKGFAVGNSLRLSAVVTTTLIPRKPDSLMSGLYGWQFTDKYRKQSNFRYRFMTTETDLHEDLETGEMSPAWNNADPSYASQSVVGDYDIGLDTAGINQSFGAYLGEGRAIRVQECIAIPNLIPPFLPPLIPECHLRTQKTTIHVDVGSDMLFDVFPATLDGFYSLAARDDGYALDWANNSQVPFPVLMDADGDGLRSRALGGTDPNDSLADTDGDGLSDLYEQKLGTDPADTDGDTDNDVLSDYDEVRLGTNPLRPDSDYDGLWDGDEVAGWKIAYGYTATGDVLVTRVSSDPLEQDTDGDGLIDKLEYVYGYNPQLPGPADVLSISSEISDEDGLVKPGDTIVYTATIENETDLRYGLGLFEVEFPVAVQNLDLEPQPYFLAPHETTTMMGSVQVEPDLAQSQQVSLTNRAGAIIADLDRLVDNRDLWLHLDEGANATFFVDDAMRGHDGWCSAPSCPAAGQDGYAGRALEFDGGDQVEVSQFVPSDQIETSATLAFWFKTSCDNCGLFSTGRLITSVGWEYPRQIYLSSGNVCARIEGQTICSSGIDYSNDRWHLVVHTMSGLQGGQRLMVDGVERASGNRSVSYLGSLNRVYLGYAPAASQDWLTGRLDEVEVFHRALDQAEITARFTQPIVHLTFDVSLDADSSIYRQPVTCYTGKCPGQTLSGVLGKADTFNQKQAMKVGPADSLDLSQGEGHFSLATWIYPQNNDGQWHGVVGYQDPSDPNQGYPSLWVNGRQLKATFGTGSRACQVLANWNALTLNTWQHVAATFDGVSFKLYVEGRQIASDANCSGEAPINLTTFDVGRTYAVGTIWFDRVEVEDEGDGAGDAELWLKVDGLGVWAKHDIGAGTTHSINVAKDVWGDMSHNLQLIEVDSIECCRGDDDELIYETFFDTDLGDHSQNYDEDGAGTLYWSIDNEYFKGRLDDVRLYNYALSSEEVDTLYAGRTHVLETRFDEPPPRADLFRDYSGNGADGVCAGDTCPVTGLAGRASQAARFEGDDTVDVVLDVSESDYTLSLWFKTVAGVPCNNCGLYAVVSGGNHDRDLYLKNGRICAYLGTEEICSTSSGYSDGTWHHVIHTFGGDVGGQKLYVDGVQAASGSVSSSSFSAQTGVQIGRSARAGQPTWTGYIDQVNVLRRARALDATGDLDRLVPALKLSFDEPLGATTFVDQADPAHSGTCSGDQCPKAGADGWIRSAPEFDGDDLIQAPVGDLGLERFTIALWVKPTRQSPDEQTLLVKTQPGVGWRGQCMVYIQPDSMKTSFILYDLYSPIGSGSISLLQDQWNHVVVTYGSGNWLRIYINGTEANAQQVSSLPGFGCENAAPFLIGRVAQDVWPSAFTGQIDELTVYDRALSFQEVNELYEYEVTWYDSSASHDITVDADDPVATLVFSPTVVNMAPGRLIGIEAWDQTTYVARLEYRVNGGSWQEASRDGRAWILSFTPAAEGLQTIEARAVDAVGNQSAVDSVSFRADGTAPAVALDSAYAQHLLPVVQATAAVTTTAEVAFPRWTDTTSVQPGHCWHEPGEYIEGSRTRINLPTISRVDLELPFVSLLEEGDQADWQLSINGVVVGTFTVLAEEFPGWWPYTTEGTARASFGFPAIAGPVYDIRLELINPLDPYSGICLQHWAPAGTLKLYGSRDEPVQYVELAGSVDDPGDGAGPALTRVTLANAAGEAVWGPQAASLTGERWSLDYSLPPQVNGRFSVQLEAEDLVGHAITRTDEMVVLDGTPPGVDISQTGDDPYALSGVGSSATITGTVYDLPCPSGQRLQLHLEETAGATTFYDGSGHNFDATCAGAACPSAGEWGRWGRAARFDGDDYLLVENAVLTTTDSTLVMNVFSATDYSLLAWVNPGATGQGTILAATSPADESIGAWLEVAGDGRLLYRYQPGGGEVVVSTTLTLRDGAWHHVAALKDAGQLVLVVDDGEVVTGTATADLAGPLDLTIGRRGRGLAEGYYRGLLDEVVLYERALTVGQAQTLARPGASGVASLELRLRHAMAAHLEEGLVVQMHLDEPAGATAFADSGPAGDDGRCLGSGCPAAGQAGVLGQGLEFDGVDDSVDRGLYDGGRQAVEVFTLAAWVRPDDLSGERRVLTYGDLTPASSEYYDFYHRDVFLGLEGGRYVVGYTGTDWLGQGSIAIPPGDLGQWVHLAGSFDGSSWRIYRNGQLAATVYVSATLDVEGETWRAGSTVLGDELFFDGGVDEVAIWNRALSSDEISVLADPASLYHQWQPVTLEDPGAGLTRWHYQVPPDVEGPYRIDLRATDAYGHGREIPNAWSGEIDTWAPRVSLAVEGSVELPGGGGYEWVTCAATDLNLVETGFSCPFATHPVYQSAEWYTALFSRTRLYGYQGTIGANLPRPQTATACDAFGQCSVAALDGAQANTIQANGGLVALVITPTAESVYTTLNPIELGGYAGSPDSLLAMTVTVNGVPISTTVWPPGGVTETLWSLDWAPPGEGAYTVDIQTRDGAGRVISETDYPPTIHVDTAAPAIALTTAAISRLDWDESGTVTLNGLITETAGVRRLQVRLNANGWEEAPVPPAAGAFAATVWSGTTAPPENQSWTIAARVTDWAGQTAEASRTVPADAVPPLDPAGVAFQYQSLAGPIVITPGVTIADTPSPTLSVQWSPSRSPDVAGYTVRWLNQVTDTWQVLRTATLLATDPLSDSLAAGELEQIHLDLISRDAFGNESSQRFGPFHIDYRTTPNLIALGKGTPTSGWMENGCSLLGVDRRPVAKTAGGEILNREQQLYLAWDAAALRLAWTGADWRVEGDLLIYLDTGPGGTNLAYDPYTLAYTDTVLYLPGRSPAGEEPGAMQADHAIWVEDADTAWLISWGGTGWLTPTQLSSAEYRFDPACLGGRTDLYLPFATLGISSPELTSLDLVALASDEDALRPWATLPAANPLSSERSIDTAGYAGSEFEFALAHRYHWSGLGPLVCPNADYPETDGQVALWAEPAGAGYRFLSDDLFWLWDPLLGDKPVDISLSFDFLEADTPALAEGQTVSYTLRYHNRGSEAAAGVRVALTARYALALRDGPPGAQVLWLGDAGPGETITVAFRGQVGAGALVPWAALEALVYDDGHDESGPPLEWLWLDHPVDARPPQFVGVSQPEHLLRVGENRLLGYAYDDSGVPTVTLTMQSPAGGSAELTCPDETPDDGAWHCLWDTVATNGGLPPADGDVFGVRLGAVDGLGLANDLGLEPVMTYTVDAIAPTVTLVPTQSQVMTFTRLLRDGSYRLVGQVNDNWGLGAVEVCQEATCNPAVVQLTAGAGLVELTGEPVAPLPIGGCGGGEVVQTWVVTQSFPVGDISLGINISHTLRDELEAVLESPTGRAVTVIAGEGSVFATGRHYDLLLNDAFEAELHTWASDDPAVPLFDRPARPYEPLRALLGENAAGEWRLTICDTKPAENDGSYNLSRLTLRPQNTASQQGWWSYRATVGAQAQDGVAYDLSIYGVDLVGNRSIEPLTVTVVVDSVPPVITVTTTPTGGTPLGDAILLAGTSADGGGIRAMRLSAVAPDGVTLAGRVPIEPIPGSEDRQVTWTYTDTSRLVAAGTYTLYVEALDQVGNRAVAGPIALWMVERPEPRRTYLPLVFNRYQSRPAAPDLIGSAVVSETSVLIEVVNIGPVTVTHDLRVDLYFDPDPRPAAGVTWQAVSTYGAHWLIPAASGPIAPGGRISLTLAATAGSSYPPPAQFDQLVQAFLQVDTLDQVAERHEIEGGFYNNVIAIDLRPLLAPDLVIDEVNATAGGIGLVIRNQGTAPVADTFWVDVYIDPDPAPTTVNQTWNQLADEGLVWAIDGAALPLDPGETLALTMGGSYYRPDLSFLVGPLPAGTPVYAQVDSVNLLTTYGGVLESHEMRNTGYNNIVGPLASTAQRAGTVGPGMVRPAPAVSADDLPARRPVVPKAGWLQDLAKRVVLR